MSNIVFYLNVPGLLTYLFTLFFKGIIFFFAGIFILGLLAIILWCAGKVYFGGKKLCQKVHDNLSIWWENARKLLTYKPQATEEGFICTLLWPFLITLNVLVLAQILEMFFPGGRRITLPWVGTYATFPLIMGFLYAISQTLLGIIFKSIEAKTFWNKVAKVLLLLVVFLTIIAEAGLAIYRARLLSAGAEMFSPTRVDMIIFRYGPWLAGFVGFFVPIAESLTGALSFLKFIKPMLKASLRWFGGLIYAIGCGAAWWILGFHSLSPREEEERRKKEERRFPAELPKPVIELGEEILGLRNRVNNLQRECEKLNEKSMILNRFDKLKKDLEGLKEEKGSDEDWSTQIRKRSQEIDQAENRSQIYQRGQEIEDMIKKMERLQTEIQSLEGKFSKLPKLLAKGFGSPSQTINFQKRDDIVTLFESQLRRTEDERRLCLAFCEELRNYAQELNEEIRVLLQEERDYPSPKILIPKEIIRLQQLLHDAKEHSDPIKREKASQILNECPRSIRRAKEELSQIETNLKGIKVPTIEKLGDDPKWNCSLEENIEDLLKMEEAINRTISILKKLQKRYKRKDKVRWLSRVWGWIVKRPRKEDNKKEIKQNRQRREPGPEKKGDRIVWP